MQRAILNEDLVVQFVLNGGTEVGSAPPGVGLERLRFDGSQLVDLAALSTIYVRQLDSGAYELHAVNVPGSVAVAMTYADRRNLINDAGNGIRVMTAQEIEDRDPRGG